MGKLYFNYLFYSATHLDSLKVNETDAHDLPKLSEKAIGSASNKCSKKRRTFELDAPTLSAQNTPSSDDVPDKARKSRTNAQTEVYQEPSDNHMHKNMYNKDSSSHAGISGEVWSYVNV